MNLRFSPSRAAGTVTVPPSKSMAHRLLICAALAEGKSTVENVDFSEDISATCDCLRALGASLTVAGNRVSVTGCGGRPRPSGVLPCRESGSTLRFMIPLCLSGEKATLTGSDRLLERPLSVYEDLFAPRGISLLREKGAVSVQGVLQGGEFSLPGDVSSQFLTGLLFALPLCEADSRIRCTTPLESASYLDLTLAALKQFGVTVTREGNDFLIPGGQTYRPQTVTVEGDESNAAFLGALAVMGDPVTLSGRNPHTLQGDRVWEPMFARLVAENPTLSLANCPDLAPVLMTLAAYFHGATFTHTRRLKIKESDRGTVMAEELAKFGAKIRVEEDSVTVLPAPLHPPSEALLGHNDHRVVMSLSLLCTRFGGTLEGAQAVRKSYPRFFDVMNDLKVRFEEL
ncbi:MAG: 3-phosphoshikimate 1-carboxyvinyltransferase [Clostridia bacterium]|nr:3-phosphoshikimate 1-carboxyvinyltransferase [Clostridia bacterium]